MTEDSEPEMAVRPLSRKKKTEDRETKSNLMEEDLVQESQYSVRHDAQQAHKSNQMEKGKNKVKIVNNDF